MFSSDTLLISIGTNRSGSFGKLRVYLSWQKFEGIKDLLAILQKGLDRAIFLYTRKLSARFARASTFLAPAESFLTTSDNLHRSTVTEALLEKDMS